MVVVGMLHKVELLQLDANPIVLKDGYCILSDMKSTGADIQTTSVSGLQLFRGWTFESSYVCRMC